MDYINNTQITLKSNDVDIIASGTAMTFIKDANLRVSLRLSNDFLLSVIFQFEDDFALDKPELKMNISGHDVKIICVNFNDFIGVGTSRPLKLVDYEDKTIYLNFWVRTPEEKTVREVKYCFYLGGDSDNE